MFSPQRRIYPPILRFLTFCQILFFIGELPVSPLHAYSDSEIPKQIKGIELNRNQPMTFDFKNASLASVLVFLSIECPCSKSHEKTLEKLNLEYKKKGILFIGIHSNANVDLASAQSHFKNAGLSFPIIEDKNAEIANQFRALKTPDVYIISPSGEILFQGGIDNSKTAERATKHYLKEALVHLINGENIPEKNVRVVGCEIKRP